MIVPVVRNPGTCRLPYLCRAFTAEFDNTSLRKSMPVFMPRSIEARYIRIEYRPGWRCAGGTAALVVVMGTGGSNPQSKDLDKPDQNNEKQSGSPLNINHKEICCMTQVIDTAAAESRLSSAVWSIHRLVSSTSSHGPSEMIPRFCGQNCSHHPI